MLPNSHASLSVTFPHGQLHSSGYQSTVSSAEPLWVGAQKINGCVF